jgi:hypothetical protein
MYMDSNDFGGPEDRARASLMSGLCCSQTIAKLCLEDMGKENEDMIAAMAAFCGGMGEGKVCGTLSAAIAMLHVTDTPADDPKRMQKDLMDWFYDRFGSLDCEDLVHGDPFKKLDFCPGCVIETYNKIREDFL